MPLIYESVPIFLPNALYRDLETHFTQLFHLIMLKISVCVCGGGGGGRQRMSMYDSA